MSTKTAIALAVTLALGAASLSLTPASARDQGLNASEYGQTLTTGEKNWMDHASQNVDGGGY